jgi:hypothetical protein
MKRSLLIILPLILAAAATAVAGTSLVARGGVAVGGPIYGVAQVYRDASNQPTAWNGRTVLVRGYVIPQLQALVGTPGGEGFLLTDTTTAVFGKAPALLVAVDPGRDWWLRWLRQLPGVRAVLPSPRQAVVGARATYRVRVQVVTSPVPCSQQEPCIAASLLDE